MATEIKIGQQGKLGKEILTVVSVNGDSFTCDNGKSYKVAYASWLTSGKVVAPRKEKKAKPISQKEIDELNNENEISLSEFRAIEARLEERTNNLKKLL